MAEKRQRNASAVSRETGCRRVGLFFRRKFFEIIDYFNLKNPLKGYVLILVLAVLPVLLFGAKYVLDQRTLSNRQSIGARYIKQCAQEAALEVAKKWNPALTYAQQRESMLRIADDVYNAAPTYMDSTVIQAVHGLDVPKEFTVKGGNAYEPLQVIKTADSLSPSLKQIARTENTTDMKKYYFYYWYSTNRAPMAVWHFRIIYNSLNRENSSLLPPDEDICTNYCYACPDISNPLESRWYHWATWPEIVGMERSHGSSTVSTINYTTRTDLTDETVKIECENDKIKVTTDDDVAYAVPAECNVDIILTVPTNNAALNKDNYDKNTVTAGMPYAVNSSVPTTEAQSTPMYQVTREYREFLKKFFYTRGVNVGVIPYSGNVSLFRDRSKWVKSHYSFNPSYFLNIELQSAVQPMIMGSMMYATTGTTGENLASVGLHGGGGYAYGLAYRGNNTVSYNGNSITTGDLLSTADPSGNKFRYMIYNPCYAGNANLLSMKCEKGGDKYWINPYPILEMTPNVKFIYEMLGAFYPYYDDRNVSNFIFIPVTWANNLLQEWSAKGENSGANTSDDSENLGRLSTPSKTTAGRKKALILVVNKPDWFEPGELTYLGFDNDYSEIPMIESDCIRGDIDYSDTTKYFADGTNYDGTVQGAKKIIKLTGFTRNATTGLYECDNGTARLKFPQKYLVKLVVEGKITWTNAGKFHEPTTSNDMLGWGNIAWDGTKFLTGTRDAGVVITSTDGEHWESTATNTPITMILRPAYGGGKWLAMGATSGILSYWSTDGINWTQVPKAGWYAQNLAYGNDGFMCVNRSVNVYWCTLNQVESGGGLPIIDSTSLSSISTGETNYNRALGFCNGKWCYITWSGKFVVSYDNGVTWAVESLSGASPGEVTGTTSEWYGPVYGFGRYWAICRGDNGGSLGSGNTDENNSNSRIVFSRDGKTWYKDNAALGTLCGTTRWFRGLGFNGEKFVSASDDGYFAYGDCNATIRFTNITSNETHCTQAGKEYKVTEKQEFFIEPDQISDPSTEGGEYEITFDASNLRLVSAEITNRPYEIDNEHYVPTESDANHSLMTTYVHVSTKRPIKVKYAKYDHMTVCSVSPANGATMPKIARGHSSGQQGTFTLYSGDPNIYIAHNRNSDVTYDSGCFANCYSDHKANITISRGYIAGLKLTNQKIRFRFGHNYYNECNGQIGSGNTIWNGESSSANDCYWAADAGCSVTGISSIHECNSYWGMHPFGSGDSGPKIEMKIPPSAGSGNLIAGGVGSISITRIPTDEQYIASDAFLTVYSQIKNENASSWDAAQVLFEANPRTSEEYSTTAFNYVGDSNAKNVKISIDQFSDSTYWCLSDLTFNASGTGTDTNNVVRFEQDGQNLIGLRDELGDSGKIFFCGTGDLTIQIRPVHAMIRAENLKRNGWETLNSSYSSMAWGTATLDPSKHYYEPYEGGYRIKIQYRGKITDHEDNDTMGSVRFTKIRLPQNSRYIDYSKNTNNQPEMYLTSISNDSFYDNWAYNETNGYWSNTTSRGYESTLTVENFTGDYTSLGYSDEIYNALWYYAGGRTMPSNKIGPYDAIQTSGLNRFYTGWENRPNTVYVRDPGFMWSKYNNSKFGSLYWIMGTMTLPINAALWAGASGGTLHHYQWQSDANGNWNGKDATEAVKEVTKSACTKLKTDWGNNLHVYLIRYRKQDKYKHPVTQAETDFDYSYLNACATENSDDYIYDITETDPAAARTQLNQKLQAIADHIKEWAGYTEAKNVEG